MIRVRGGSIQMQRPTYKKKSGTTMPSLLQLHLIAPFTDKVDHKLSTVSLNSLCTVSSAHRIFCLYFWLTMNALLSYILSISISIFKSSDL